MKHIRDRTGFTLVEMMVASSIGFAMLAAIATAFLFCQRTFYLTMAEAESSIALRKIRDRLLFHAGPESDKGLLTGKLQADSASITLKDDSSDFRLVWRTDPGSDRVYFFNERLAHTTANINWFKPSAIQIQNVWSKTVDLPRLHLVFGEIGYGIIPSPAWIILPVRSD